jgi:hypothetical protein
MITTLDIPSTTMPYVESDDIFPVETKLKDKVKAKYTEDDHKDNRITRETIKDLFAAGVLSKVAYVALCLRLDQPITGELQQLDPIQYGEELTFDRPQANGKEKTFGPSPSDVEVAIAALQKKGCLQCDKPPVQLTIGLMY